MANRENRFIVDVVKCRTKFRNNTLEEKDIIKLLNYHTSIQDNDVDGMIAEMNEENKEKIQKNKQIEQAIKSKSTPESNINKMTTNTSW